MTTRAALAALPRPVRPVTLPGGGTVHVRGLTVAELRRIDARAADEADDPGEGVIRTTLLMAAAALAEPDGAAVFPSPTGEDLDLVAAALTPEQVEAVIRAAVPTKDRAKNA